MFALSLVKMYAPALSIIYFFPYSGEKLCHLQPCHLLLELLEQLMRESRGFAITPGSSENTVGFVFPWKKLIRLLN